MRNLRSILPTIGYVFQFLYTSDFVLGTLVPQYCWSRQGNAIIMLGEYRFKKRSKPINQKQETHWVCNKSDKGCKAKLTTLNDFIVKIHNVHDHNGPRKNRAGL